MKLVLILFSLIAANSAAVLPAATGKSPIVLVPGDGGSQIWAKLNKPSDAGKWWCQKKTSNYFLLWLDLADVVFPAVECLADNMKLLFNPATNKTTDNVGVEITVPGFGNPKNVEWLSSVHFSKTDYFNSLAEYLVKNLGYIRDFNLRGAPYDFRKGPGESIAFYEQLGKLIEETYIQTGNQKVVLLGHSLGCKQSLHFLQTKSAEWKSKYIKSFIAAAGPFAGAVNSVQAVTSGYNVGMFWNEPIWFRETQRSWPSSYFLLPSEKIWPENQVLVRTPMKSYTVRQLDNLFADMGMTEMFGHQKKILSEVNTMSPPGVETHCIYGIGVKTAETLVFNKQSDFPDKKPSIVYGDGDGTVNRRSLETCLEWQNMQNQAVNMIPLTNAEHLDMLKDNRFIEQVANLL